MCVYVNQQNNCVWGCSLVLQNFRFVKVVNMHEMSNTACMSISEQLAYFLTTFGDTSPK